MQPTTDKIAARILRPGYLVALRSTVNGGPRYSRMDVSSETTSDGAAVATWLTTREVQDPVEYEAAIRVRSKCRTLITGVCSRSEFGLLCPVDRGENLRECIAAARKLADDFNATSATCHVSVYAIAGRIADDDVEAARAISSEIRDLLSAMQSGIAAADPEAIRDAANRARSIGAMLSGDAADAVSSAIDQARAAAREITRRVEKSGERAADVIAELRTEAIASARFAFLDLDEEKEVEDAPVAARAVEFAPPDESPEVAAAMAEYAVPSFDFI